MIFLSILLFIIPHQAIKYRDDLIREARARWGMAAPISIFAAQIHQESRWKEEARSPVGALGMAQFMPGTAKWISELYPADLGSNNPLDPHWALRALVFYDSYLYDRLSEFKDDASHRWGAALSAYNGGLLWVRRDRALTIQRGAELCDEEYSRWFWCVALWSNRAQWAFRENRGYPVNILFKWRPEYRSWDSL